MNKYIIDTEKGTCVPYPVAHKSPLELMQADVGAKEWDATVTKIQTWYYGKMVKTAWCASSASYYLYVAGLGIAKACNVYKLLQNCKDAKCCAVYAGDKIPTEIKRGDILFWLWKGDTMTASSSKHVGFCAVTTKGDTISCTGGNQDDKICTKTYDRKYLYAIARLEG